MRQVIMVVGILMMVGVMLLTGCRPPELEGVVINMNQGLYDKAYELAQDAVKKYPDNPEAWYLLGELQARKNMFAEMSESFDKSLAVSAQFKPQIEQMRLKYFAENYNDALKNFYNPARDVEDPIQKREMYSKAAEKFLASHQSMPSRIEPLSPMAVSFLESGDTTSAEKYILMAIDKNPTNDTLMVSVGDFYYKINQIDKAKAMYEKAVTANSNSVDAYLALGEIYTKKEDWDKALENWNAAMKLQPNNPAIPNNIAIVLYNNGKYEETIPLIKKTLELEPDNESAHELMSLSYMQSAQKYHEKYDETEKQEYLDKAINIYAEALPFLQGATARFPTNSLLWNNLGVCYAQKGMKDEAAKAFEKQKELEESQQ